MAFIQKGVIDLQGRLIDKAICVENLQNSLSSSPDKAKGGTNR